MGYTALYRKFRPKNFYEIVGQDHITQTLKNQIKTNRIGHAYLLTGGRGTGKTTTAKIFARAINCLNPKDGEPCNECEMCKSMLDGSLTDVVEMDAASNNSVDDIRSIREEVNFLPTRAKYRVYIIDEVHMLSTGAFNALLKTLEEPPAHVKFILATTEPQKLLPTILSRCQRFDFKKISNEDLIKRMKIVCKESKIQITEPALNLIATLSEGAARDALSILERCLQDGDTDIDEDKIKDLVGIPKFEYVNNITKAIIEKDVEKAISSTENILDEGKDLGNFLWEMIKYTKDILIYKVSKKLDIYSEDEKKQIQELSEKTSKEELINIIYKLSELENKMRLSSQKTIIFETEIIKLCMNQDTKALEDRIEKLEKKIQSGPDIIDKSENKQKSKPQVETKNIKKSENNVSNIEKTNENESDTKKAKEDSIQKNKEEKTITKKEIEKEAEDGNKLEGWQKILENLKKQGKVILYANLINTEAVEENDMTVKIKFYSGLNSFRKELLEKSENMSVLTKEVAIMCGKTMHIKLEDASASNAKQAKVEPAKEEEEQEKSDLMDLDIPINIIEE